MHAGNTVMARQTLIEERIVGTQQLDDAAILAYLVVDEQFRFGLIGCTEAFIESRKDGRVWRGVAKIAQLKPLPRKILHEGSRPRIRKQSADLLIEYGWRGQASLGRCIEQFAIWNAAPQKERQPRRKLQA